MKMQDLESLVNFEPFWKILLSNNAILPLLWSLFPGHPNLKPAFYDNPIDILGEDKFEKLNVKNWIALPLYT